jgi:hypothetical protein
MIGPRGQAIVNNIGYVTNLPANELPPNWDINADHIADINDVILLGSYWRQSGPMDLQDALYPFVRGWTRADINFDGTVNVLDISEFSSYWNHSW